MKERVSISPGGPMIITLEDKDLWAIFDRFRRTNISAWFECRSQHLTTVVRTEDGGGEVAEACREGGVVWRELPRIQRRFIL